MQLYGIEYCDRVRGARRWLKEAGFEFEFIDVRKRPPSEATLHAWLEQVTPGQLVNRRSPTWRRMTPRQRVGETTQHWVNVLLKYPILIRRPLLVQPDGEVICAFDPAEHGAGLRS